MISPTASPKHRLVMDQFMSRFAHVMITCVFPMIHPHSPLGGEFFAEKPAADHFIVAGDVSQHAVV